MHRVIIFAVLSLFAAVALAELSEKLQRKLDTTDAAYKTAVSKADNARFYAVQKASGDRVKALKQLQTEATKAGDLDGATEIKGRIAAAESEGSIRSKPNDLVKFAGHEYAIIDEKLTFYRAKRRCEEMGGHLVAIETLPEQEFVLSLCRARNQRIGCWIGVTNEDGHEKWVWVTGTTAAQAATWRQDDADLNAHAHAMIYWPATDGFDDANLGTRMGYVCEWDK